MCRPINGGPLAAEVNSAMRLVKQVHSGEIFNGCALPTILSTFLWILFFGWHGVCIIEPGRLVFGACREQ